jgi:AraC family transcriptional regulator
MNQSRSSLPAFGLQPAIQQVRLAEDWSNGRNRRSAREDAPQTSKLEALLPAQRPPPINGDDERSDFHRPRLSDGYPTTGEVHPAVEISPPEAVKRRTVTGHGMAAESLQSSSRSKIRYRFCAPMHLLVVHEKGERRDGETFVEGLPRSTLRSLERKLTFVPAGHEYDEWEEPRRHTRRIHFYFDPAKLNLQSELPDRFLSPRLFFEDATLWHTALKLKSLVESQASGDRLYFEALGTLFVHELVRLDRGIAGFRPENRGGLAPWQQRIVTTHIEEHFAEHIPIATVAQLVRLSRFHFCRVFKQTFETTPHRYQTNCRIERAKLLLATPAAAVTDIGLAVGFSSSNAFATTFRKATGFTPTAYRRSLAPASGSLPEEAAPRGL